MDAIAVNAMAAADVARRARPGLPRERAGSDTAVHVLGFTFQTSRSRWFIIQF